MIRPCRSAKWPGTSFQPSAPKTNGPPMSSTSASAHSAPCAAPSANAAADQQPDADGGAAGQPDDRLPQLGIVAAGEHEQRDLADPHDRRRRRRTAAPSRRTPRARRARRRATPPSRRTSRAAPRPLRDRPRSSATRSRPTPTTARRARAAPSPTPAHVGSSAISAVHWVSASTKTRSKNSSSGVTRSSWRSTAVNRCVCADPSVTGRLSHRLPNPHQGRLLDSEDRRDAATRRASAADRVALHPAGVGGGLQHPVALAAGGADTAERPVDPRPVRRDRAGRSSSTVRRRSGPRRESDAGLGLARVERAREVVGVEARARRSPPAGPCRNRRGSRKNVRASTGPAGRRRACRRPSTARRPAARATASASSAAACRGASEPGSPGRGRTSARACRAGSPARGSPARSGASRRSASPTRGCRPVDDVQVARCRRAWARPAPTVGLASRLEPTVGRAAPPAGPQLARRRRRRRARGARRCTPRQQALERHVDDAGRRRTPRGRRTRASRTRRPCGRTRREPSAIAAGKSKPSSSASCWRNTGPWPHGPVL